jgi:hypothetical protein
MNNDSNNIKIIVAIVGFIIIIYFANVTIKNIKQNKDKATIENATKILNDFNVLLGGFTDKQKNEFIVLYRQKINTDLHKELFKILKKISKSDSDGGDNVMYKLTAEEKKDLKYFYDNVINIIKLKENE